MCSGLFRRARDGAGEKEGSGGQDGRLVRKEGGEGGLVAHVDHSRGDTGPAGGGKGGLVPIDQRDVIVAGHGEHGGD